jgi:prepilin-type N-terminal cleavage/methylation domain-containing protein
MDPMRKGFTLIELLIVVAIIAILAAIAVPNFLEAQTRSKVSRSKADIRTLATAIEVYTLDNAVGPSDRGNNSPGRPYDMWDDGQMNYSVEPKANFTIGFELTTPIAYLSSVAALRDAFKVQRYTGQSTGREYYCFASWRFRQKSGLTIGAAVFNRSGEWVVMGAGPDKYVNNIPGGTDFSNAIYIPEYINYDPTNGTISNGDIYRSQKYSDNQPELHLR